MFFAGIKSTVLKSETLHDITCPKCNALNSTKVSILGFYKHVIQIPFLSGGKSGVSECNKCKQHYSLKNMPATIKLAYFELKETTKTPIWFFSGLIVIKILVLIKIFSRNF